MKIAIDNIEVKLLVMTRAFFVLDFCHLVTKNKMGCDLFKGFLGKKRPNITVFWGKQKLNLPYLDHRFLYVAKYNAGFENKSIFLSDL
jgi:hypothetical protein